MNKYQTVALNTVYILFGTVGSKLIFFFLLPLYTRWLETEEYGATDAITVYTSVLSSIVFLNIADAIFVCPKLAPSI
jgi:O-antigen/teichoic acid export membrane protein